MSEWKRFFMIDLICRRSLLVSAVLLALCATGPVAAELTVSGHALLRGSSIRSQPSWLAGGFGRLPLGGSAPADSAEDLTGQLHITLDWQATPFFGAFVHAVGRAEPSSTEGRAAGVIEAYLHGGWDVSEVGSLRLQLGHFLLPTSKENVEVGWASPYTLTFSALNNWIGEEVRLSGLFAEYSANLGDLDEFQAAGSAFGGNDTTGALLAWRGWTLGDRLTTFDEVVPLPPILALADGGPFAPQLDRGSRPFGDDLDDRVGWAGSLRWWRPETAAVQWTRYDNRGDRLLHDQEYAWRTRYDLLGFELHRGDSSGAGTLSLLGEYLNGETGMGETLGPQVQVDFETAYLMASWQIRSWRLSVRFETFEVTDRDDTPSDDNNDDGEAWTFAAFWDARPDLRLGIEYLDLDSSRPPAALAGFDPDTDARSLLLELRYYFDL